MKMNKLFVFIPLLLPVWEKGPFDSVNTSVPIAPFHAENQAIKMQADYYSKAKDPLIRSKIAVSLIPSGNPAALETLEGFLQNEKNELVQADILSSLYNMRDIGNCKKVPLLKGLLTSRNPSARAFAAALYMKASNDVAPVYEALAAETSDFVMNFTWSEIASSPELCKVTRDSDIDKFLALENPSQRAGAVKVAVIKSQDPDKEARISKILSDKNAVVKYTLASALARKGNGGIALLKTLSEDKDVSIRAVVASASPCADRLPIHVKLSSDADAEVRKLASVSLGSYKNPEAINALITGIADKAKQVREASESSLMKINPDKDVLKKIGDECLNSKDARAAAVSILGGMKDTRYSADIAKILESAEDSDSDLARRCVTALGSLGYRESWKAVSAKASHKNDDVRKAVASTLGIFKMKESYDTIAKLSDDASIPVSTQAIEAMGWTADPFFSDKLLSIIKKTVSDYPFDNRSFACWAIARINSPNKGTLSQLNDLCMKTVLKVPQSPNSYDSDHVRISALFALVDTGRKNPEAMKIAENVIGAYLSDSKGNEELAGEVLKEYARQAKAYINNEKIAQVEVKPVPPIFLLEETKKK